MTRQQRMAAKDLSCPWRGPVVHAAVPGFSAANRAAALYLYRVSDTPSGQGGRDQWMTLGSITSMHIHPDPALGGRGSF